MKQGQFNKILVKVLSCKGKSNYHRLIGLEIEVIKWGNSYYKYINTYNKSVLILKSDCEIVNKITVDDNIELEEQVNHPVYYGGAHNKYEAIKVIEALNMDFHLGNTFKYIARAGVKSKETEIEDLQKAAWYLNRKIENLKKQKQ